MTPTSFLLPEQPLALRTSHLIGRTDLVSDLRSAIGDTTRQSQAFYFIGEGGVGKTRLLEEVDVIQQNWQGQSFRCTPIIDLYHSEHHSPSGLRKAIISGLDPANEFFQEYWNTLERYRENRAAQAPNAILEPLRQELEDQFNEAYTRLADQYRLVMRFDTFELVQHESDLVQQLCQVDDPDTAIKAWFLQQINPLPNTVILFAGRPQLVGQAQIIDEIEQKYVAAGYSFQRLPLTALSLRETENYLEDLRLQRPDELSDILTSQNKKALYAITGGRPIYLALLVDLALQPGQGDFLTNWPAAQPDQHAREQALRMRLAEMLLRELDEPLAEVVHFLIFARKGLDYNLLSFLVKGKWSDEKIADSLYQAQKLAIVKSRDVTSHSNVDDKAEKLGSPLEQMQLFLHDEVYDLFDAYYVEPKHRVDQEFANIANYYRKQPAPATSGADREDWQLNQIYYELQVNPAVGYFRHYVRRDEEAVRVHEIDFDMRLRDEVLRFINRYSHPNSPFLTERVAEQINREEIERDAAVRWVKRYVARSKTKIADQVAERIRNSTEPPFQWDGVDDPLYQAGLLTAWSEALLYIADEAKRKQAYAMLEEAIGLLEANPHWDEDRHWIWMLTRGKAHNHIGYLYRTEGRYGLARRQYQHALTYFAEIKLSSEEANTRNNLAFALALLGRLPAARKHAEQALKTRQSEGKPYPIALSRNTLGRIYTLEDHPIWGERECSTALGFFESFRAPRGIGLACNSLGFALRQRGNHWKLGETVYPVNDVEQYFGQADKYLNRAIQIFSSGDTPEPLRLWEAYNELGSLYCDWGWLARQAKEDAVTALEYYTASVQHQEKALAVAEEHHFLFQLADSLDDLAQAFGDQSFLLLSMGQEDEARECRAQAEAHLERIETLIPEAFKLIAGQGFGDAPEPGEAYWLSLGKVHFWRGVWAFRDLEANNVVAKERDATVERAMAELIEAIAYFQHYDESRSYQLQRTIRYITDFVQEQQIPANQLRDRIDSYARMYALNLAVLHEAVDDMLGV